MKVPFLLCVGAVAGISLVAPNVLSQQTAPRPPSGQQPQPYGQKPEGGMGGQVPQEFKEALTPLVGTWDVTVRTFTGGQATPSGQTQGNSTIKWILDNKIAQEEVRTGHIAISQAGGNIEQVSQPPRGGESMTESFQGMGLFGYDARSDKFLHVWADNFSTELSPSIGTYDTRSKTLTFNVKRPGMEGERPMPGAGGGASTPPRRPGTPPGDDAADNSQLMEMLQAQPGQPQPPGAQPPGARQPEQPQLSSGKLSNISRIVIRVMSNDRHVVEYYEGGAGGAGGQQNKVMEVDYTRSR